MKKGETDFCGYTGVRAPAPWRLKSPAKRRPVRKRMKVRRRTTILQTMVFVMMSTKMKTLPVMRLTTRLQTKRSLLRNTMAMWLSALSQERRKETLQYK